MATIKISRAKNCSAALDYGKGKNQFKEKDRQWLKDHGVNDEIANNIRDRAVVSNGLNVIDGYEKPEMKQSRDLLKNSGSTEAMRFIQSFGANELDASNPKDWKKANQMGLELAQKIAPDNQFSVYTHIDGNGHKLHNHLVMNMPDLKTGKKYNHDNDWKRVTKLSDEIIKSHGLTPLDPTKTKQPEKKSMAERQLQAKGKYVWKDDLRNQIDQIMLETENRFITSKNQFSAILKEKGIIYHERGKDSCSFEFKDKNDKLRRIRGKNLGSDYTKGAIENGLAANKVTRNVEIIGEDRQDEREAIRIQQENFKQESELGNPVRRGERHYNIIKTQVKKESKSTENFNKFIQQFSSKIERINRNVTNFINRRLERIRDKINRIREKNRKSNRLRTRRNRIDQLKQRINDKNKFLADRSKGIIAIKKEMPGLREDELKIAAINQAIKNNPKLFKSKQNSQQKLNKNFKNISKFKRPNTFKKR